MKTTLKIVLFAIAGIGFSIGNASGLSMIANNYAKDGNSTSGAVKALESPYSKTIHDFSPQTTTAQTTAQNAPAGNIIDLPTNDIAAHPANYSHRDITDGQHLHTVDNTVVKLDISARDPNIYFYLIDPADAGSITTIYANDLSNTLFANLPNASKWFIGISTDGNEGNFNTLTWATNKVEDGWGAGLISTVFPIPEPATMILLATGIAGLAGIRSRERKVSKKSRF